MNNAVLDHIRALNDKAFADNAKAPKGTFTFYLAEDLANDYDSVEEFELDMAWNAYSNAYKAKYGCRPRFNPDWDLETLRSQTV